MSITKLIAELTKLEDIAGDAPDINILNYDDDQIVAVNSALNDVYNGISQIKLSIANMVLVPRERLEKIAGFWDVTMRATDNDMARLMYDASCIAKGMLSIAEESK